MASSLFSNNVNTQTTPTQNLSAPNNIQRIKQMAQLVKSSTNPQMMIYNMLNQNPQTSQLINSFGGDPKTAFYTIGQSP